MKWLTRLQTKAGFTLIEVMIAVAIIGILAAVVAVNTRDSSSVSRDAKRQADLRSLQTALETYKNENGRYPAGCNPVGRWSGQMDTDYACPSNSGQYIPGLAPEYIKVLPVDPKLNGDESGYVYQTNAEGTVYKLKAYQTVESEIVTRNHPFKACDIRVEQQPDGFPANGNTNRDPRVIGWCTAISDGGNLTFPVTDCNENTTLFRSSYAVWGGIAPLYDGGGNAYGMNLYAADPLEVINGNATQKNIRRFYAIHDTTDVICK